MTSHKRYIPQGQYTAPRFAAESFVGRRYSIGADRGLGYDDMYSANPADYWHLPDEAPMGALFGMLDTRTVSGRPVTITRLLKTRATMRDLRRLTRAVESMVEA